MIHLGMRENIKTSIHFSKKNLNSALLALDIYKSTVVHICVSVGSK